MKAFSLYLLAATTFGLSLAGCDNTNPPKEAAQTSETATTASAASAPVSTADGSSLPAAAKNAAPALPEAKPSTVALPAGLKVGRWQAFLIAQQHAVHFVFEVAVENNKAVVYLINQGPDEQERLRCDHVRSIGDSAIINLPGTDASLVVHANGNDHLAGAWVEPNGKKSFRTAFSAVYGELSPLRLDATTPNFAGTWQVIFRASNGQASSGTLVCEQKGAKLFGTLQGSGKSYRYLSGAVLASGMGMSSFDGRKSVLLQAQKLSNGTLKGVFYAGHSISKTWTAAPVR